MSDDEFRSALDTGAFDVLNREGDEADDVDTSEGRGGMRRDEREMLIRIDERTKGLDARYVKREEFLPVQRIVYGMAGLILVGVLLGLLGLVVLHGHS